MEKMHLRPVSPRPAELSFWHGGSPFGNAAPSFSLFLRLLRPSHTGRRSFFVTGARGDGEKSAVLRLPPLRRGNPNDFIRGRKRPENKSRPKRGAAGMQRPSSAFPFTISFSKRYIPPSDRKPPIRQPAAGENRPFSAPGRACKNRAAPAFQRWNSFLL